MTTGRKVAVACVLLVSATAVLWIAAASHNSLPSYTYSQFLDQVRSGRVADVTVIGSNSGAADATYRLKDGASARTVLPSAYRDALVSMQSNRVNIEIRNSSSQPSALLVKATPFFVLLGIWLCLMFGRFPVTRQFRSRSNRFFHVARTRYCSWQVPGI